jgi:hypothetical protein
MGPLEERSRGGGLRRPLLIAVVVTGLCSLALAVPIGRANAASGTFLLSSLLGGHAPTSAAGSLSGKLTLVGQNSTFTWKLTFRRLGSRAVHAGIYFGRIAKASELAMLLCNNCASGATGYYRGSFVASPNFVHAIRHGQAYVVIQTKKRPSGEIRGLIKAKLA